MKLYILLVMLKATMLFIINFCTCEFTRIMVAVKLMTCMHGDIAAEFLIITFVHFSVFTCSKL